MVDDLISLLCGPFHGHFVPNTQGEWGEHEPGGTSMLNLLHWSQALRNGQRLCMLDFGAAENRVRYGQPTAPEYDLARIPRVLPKGTYCVVLGLTVATAHSSLHVV